MSRIERIWCSVGRGLAASLLILWVCLPDQSMGASYSNFNYSAWGTNVTITGYTGSGGNVTIPSSIPGVGTVISIGWCAFQYHSDLTKISIPNSVTYIFGYAFAECGLTNVSIPDSVTSIGDCAFRSTSLLAIDVDSNSVAYSSLGGVLFSKNQSALIACPGGVKGSYIIPSTVTSIGGNAFENCINLTNISIPSSVTHIGYGAFCGCSSLTDVSIPSSVTNIEGSAFCNCSSLTDVSIPSGVTYIGNGAFISCRSLTNVSIPTSVTNIEGSAFCNCSSLTNVSIPSSVINIEDGAFASCSSLTNISIPTSVVNIGDYAFRDCSNLTNISIPSSVVNIGDYAFCGCSSLTNISIPSSVTNIGDSAFDYCSSLTAIDVAADNPIYSSLDGLLLDKSRSALVTCPSGVAGNYTIPNNVTSIGDSAFETCDSLTSVTIPESVTSIGNSAFSNCSNLTSVTIPDSVTSIGNGAFSDCSSLTSVTIPDSVTSIGDYTFCGCSSLTNISIPNSVTSIGWYAFGYCSSLTKVKIPYSVTFIEVYAFGYCSSLAKVYFEGDASWWFGGNIFYEVASDFTIYYPSTASGWSTPTWIGYPAKPYKLLGALRVNIRPAEAVSAGAQWMVDSSAWHNSGATISGLPSGTHTIRFPWIEGWIAPDDQTVSLKNSTVTVTGTYVRLTGAMQVTIASIAAVKSGAKWQVDGGAFQPSGAVLTNLAVGTHILTFHTISGWQAPSRQVVMVSDGTLTNLAATYNDTQKPRLTISSKKPLTVSDARFTMSGTATDNVAVAAVWYQQGNGAWQEASTTNSWRNWTANVVLTPGTNVLRAYAIDSSANASTTNVVTLFYLAKAPLAVKTTGLGTANHNYNGALLTIGTKYSMTAVPAIGQVFSNWTDNAGLVLTNGPTLQFMMQSNLTLTANFIPNPFIPAAGMYSGLFTNTNGIDLKGSGFFTATVRTNGTFSAKLQGPKNYLFSGLFTLNGTWSTNAVGSVGSPAVSLQLDLGGGDRLTGQITSTAWTAKLESWRDTFSKTNPGPQSGKKYTLAIAGDADSPLQPGGNGYGTINVDANGNVSFSGTLGDGTPVTSAATISKEGYWPFYCSLYSGKGTILGWLTFTNLPDRDIDGWLTWINPACSTKLYPAGFTNMSEAVGSQFSYTNGSCVLSMTNGVLILEGGNLLAGITNGFMLQTNNRGTGTNVGKLVFTNTSGLFTGSITNTATRKTITVNGVVLQKKGAGYGLFLGTNEVGSVVVEGK